MIFIKIDKNYAIYSGVYYQKDFFEWTHNILTIKKYLVDVKNNLLILFDEKNESSIIKDLNVDRIYFNLKVYMIRFLFYSLKNNKINDILLDLNWLFGQNKDYDIKSKSCYINNNKFYSIDVKKIKQSVGSDIDNMKEEEIKKKEGLERKFSEMKNKMDIILSSIPNRINIKEKKEDFIKKEKNILKSFLSFEKYKTKLKIDSYLDDNIKVCNEETIKKMKEKIENNNLKKYKKYKDDFLDLTKKLTQLYYKILLTTFLRLEERFGKGNYIRDLNKIKEDNGKFYRNILLKNRKMDNSILPDIKIKCNMLEYTVYGYDEIKNKRDEIEKEIYDNETEDNGNEAKDSTKQENNIQT